MSELHDHLSHRLAAAFRALERSLEGVDEKGVAVGANPQSVLAMVLRHGALLSVGGTVMGLLGSLAIRGVLRAVFPFEDAGNLDLSTYLIVVPTLLAITLTAAYIPARRAAHIDPLRALRQD